MKYGWDKFFCHLHKILGKYLTACSKSGLQQAICFEKNKMIILSVNVKKRALKEYGKTSQRFHCALQIWEKSMADT